MKPKNITYFVFPGIVARIILQLILNVGMLGLAVQAGTHEQGNPAATYASWSELIASMDKMHMAMEAVMRSGNADVDFVRLMLPHHQAAIDMAKTQLLYGTDAQMRRLAQEIITDQQSEIELMQRWLKQREPGAPKENQPTPPQTGKDHQK
jgi:hypothetical protein